MTILTVNIKNDKDLPLMKEILERFGLQYKVEERDFVQDEEVLYNRFKKTFQSIKGWEEGQIQLQSAKDALTEIESELNKHV